MKKVALIMIGLLFAVFALGQVPATKPNVKYHVPLTVATESETFGNYVYAGTPIFCAADSGVVYVTKTYDWSAGATLANVKASTAYYQTYTLTTFGTHGTTYYVDTANAQTITGAKDFLGVTTFGGGIASGATVSGTITVTGKETMSSNTPFAFTGTAITKGLDFSNAGLVGSSTYANSLFAYGTNSAAVNTAALAGHYVPIQVTLNSNASAAYDVACARLKITTDASTPPTLANHTVLQLRGTVNGNAGSFTGLNSSVNVAAPTTLGAIGLAAGYFKIEGASAITSATSGAYVLLATSTHTSTGVTDILCGSLNASGGTVTNIGHIWNTVGTTTNMLNIANVGGTATNGLNITGTYSGNAITTTGNVNIGGTLGVTGVITLPGGLTLSKASGDANAVQLSHSLVVGTTSDTVTSANGIFTNADVTTLKTTGTFYAKTIIKNVTPVAKTASETMSTTTLLSGVVAVTQTGAVTLTTPAATAIAGAITGSGQGTEFDLVIDNSASSVAGTVTLAFGSGVTAGTAVWTAEDTMTVTYGKVGCFHFYEVAAGDIRVYRKW